MPNKSIDKLRRIAKTLGKSALAGDAAAISRLRQHLPDYTGGPIKHAQVLHVVAQEQGFASWPRLKFAAQSQGFDRAQAQQRLKMALYHGHNPIVETLLSQWPDLAENMLGLNIALYDAAAVRAALAADPNAATKTLGPRRPILHLAFSKYIHARPELRHAMLEIAQMLLDHGADVNDGYAPQGDHKLSALYGALGHANNMVLAQWLLDNGADPNDGESLYHATELGHHDGVKMLIKAGANPRGTNALLRALDFNDHGAVEILLGAGADPNEFNGDPVGGEMPWVIPSLHQCARRMNDAKMCQILIDAGADLDRKYQGVAAFAMARAFGNDAVAEVLGAAGANTQLSPVETALAKAASGEIPTAIDANDVPPGLADILRNLIGFSDRLPHIRALVAMGFDPNAADSMGMTPIMAAGWEGRADLVAYFLTLGPDLTRLNGYGGDLMSTIIHGSENCADPASRNHVTCAKLVLEAGAQLPEHYLAHVVHEELAEFLVDHVTGS